MEIQRETFKFYAAFFILAAFIYTLSAGEPEFLWENTFGGNEVGFLSANLTVDGGFIVSGVSYEDGLEEPPDIYLAKLNANGAVQWENTFGGSGSQKAEDVKQTSDGGFILTGKSGNNIILLKTDADGNQDWLKTYDGDYGYSVVESPAGNYVATGFTVNNGETSLYLLKTDNFGEILWDKNIQSDRSNVGYALDNTDDHGLIICGSAYRNREHSDDVYLVKTDANGNVQWEKYFGGFNGERGESVCQTQSGNFVIVGPSSSFEGWWPDIYLR